MKLFLQKAEITEVIEVDPTMMVEDFAKLVAVAGFLWAGQLLRSTQVLGQLGEDTTITAVQPLDGAGKDKKRKKKAKKTPKKKKHVQQKNKLGLLKLYKVAGDKVDSLRDYCPKCGPGVRLARHCDRTHCGRCGLAGKVANPTTQVKKAAAPVAAEAPATKKADGKKKGK